CFILFISLFPYSDWLGDTMHSISVLSTFSLIATKCLDCFSLEYMVLMLGRLTLLFQIAFQCVIHFILTCRHRTQPQQHSYRINTGKFDIPSYLTFEDD